MELAGKVGILGDVHCEDAALGAARALFAERGASRVLAVGDLVDGPGDRRASHHVYEVGLRAW